MPKSKSTPDESTLDDEFQRIYDHVSDSIASGHIHDIVFDDIDRVLGIIWGSEDSTGALYDTLDTDYEKRDFIIDFKSASEWLMGWNKDDLTDDQLTSLAQTILGERNSP